MKRRWGGRGAAPSAAEDGEILRLYREGFSTGRIGVKLVRSQGFVWDRLRRMGTLMRAPGRYRKG